MNLDIKTIEVIKQNLIKLLDPSLIILFGSGVQGVFREDSDIDIAFMGKKNFEEYQVFIVAQSLAGLSGREVDLVDLRRSSTVLRAQILGKGEVIYSSDTGLLNDFRIRALKEYAMLNEERAEIMSAIATRGHVYGR